MYCNVCFRLDEWEEIEPADVIIVEGILLFFDQELREVFDLKLFVDADSDDRLARRVQRDIRERGRSLSQVCLYFFFKVFPDVYRLSCRDCTIC